MPGPNDSIPSSRAAIFVIPPQDGAEPIILGIVEDFSAVNQYASENLMAVGKFAAPDNVVNNVQARVRWGRVHKLTPTIQQTLAPQVAQFATYERFDVLAIDPVDGVPIARVVGVLPETLDINVTNGRAMRANYTGIARFVQHGQEVLEAPEAAA